jgi:uncharacterized membrane protein HdeD (DUF308 family)
MGGLIAMREIRRDENQFPEYGGDMHPLSEYRGWMIGLGVAMAVLGIIVLGSAVAATFFTMTVLGVFLLIGGIAQAIHAFRVHKSSSFLLSLLTGVLLLLVGAYVLGHPLASLTAVTFVLAIYLIVSGVTKGLFALTHRFGSWGWMMFSGIVSIFLGIFIWRGWPVTSLFTLGIFLGVDLLVLGISWLAIGLATGHFNKPHRTAF